jgi:hypothetical protein
MKIVFTLDRVCEVVDCTRVSEGSSGGHLIGLRLPVRRFYWVKIVIGIPRFGVNFCFLLQGCVRVVNYAIKVETRECPETSVTMQDENIRVQAIGKGKGKAVPLQAWSGPEGSRKWRFPDFMTTAQDGGKLVSLTHQPPLPPGNTPGTHFC